MINNKKRSIKHLSKLNEKSQSQSKQRELKQSVATSNQLFTNSYGRQQTQNNYTFSKGTFFQKLDSSEKNCQSFTSFYTNNLDTNQSINDCQKQNQCIELDEISDQEIKQKLQNGQNIKIFMGKDHDIRDIKMMNFQNSIPNFKDYIIYKYYNQQTERQNTIIKCHYQDCNKIFRKYELFFNHVRTHTKDKPFHCDQENCDKSFTQKSNLRKHLRLHLKKRLKGNTYQTELKQPIQNDSQDKIIKLQCNLTFNDLQQYLNIKKQQVDQELKEFRDEEKFYIASFLFQKNIY